jgi:uncharacterized protein (TIGR03083 family)
MDGPALLDVISADSAALVAAARIAGPGAPVLACPGWDVADLVWHVGEVQDFWEYVVRERVLDPGTYVQPARPTADVDDPAASDLEAVIRFAQVRAAALGETLAAAGSAGPVWTWAGPQDSAWVARRMAHEVAIHRVDAEQAAGREHRLPADLAADGIDEFLTYLWPVAPAGSPPLGGSVHLHCSDVDGEWTVSPDGAGGHSVAGGHAKGDAALRGAASDLLLVLWRRAPLDAVTVFGDELLARAFVDRPGLD